MGRSYYNYRKGREVGGNELSEKDENGGRLLGKGRYWIG